MLNIAEWHELFKIVFAVFVATLVLFVIFAKCIEISYKKAHKKTKKVNKVQNKKVEIIYDLGDTSKMTLYEIKQLKEIMRKELRANG